MPIPTTKERNLGESLNLPATVGIIFIITILILVVLMPCPSDRQYKIFYLILSIAIAGFASVIPGFFKIKYKNILSASGALAVFVLVYTFDPIQTNSNDKCQTLFDFTIFFEDSLGNKILENKGWIDVTIGSVMHHEKINYKGSISYNNIPARMRDSTMEIKISEEGWVFKNGKKKIEVPLRGESASLIIFSNNNCKVKVKAQLLIDTLIIIEKLPDYQAVQVQFRIQMYINALLRMTNADCRTLINKEDSFVNDLMIITNKIDSLKLN